MLQNVIRRHGTLSTVVLLLTIAPAPPCLSVPRETTTEPTQDAVGILRNILDTKDLRLSGCGKSASRVFSFSVWLAPSGHDQQKLSGAELLLHCDGSGVAFVSRSATGLPFSCVTDGLYAQLDPHMSGKLLICKDGHLVVTVGVNPTGPHLEFNYSRQSAHSCITLELDRILRGVMDHARTSALDSQTGALLFELPHGVAAVRLAPNKPPARFAVRDVLFLNHEGKVRLSISNIRTEELKGPTPNAISLTALQRLDLGIGDLPMNLVGGQVPIAPADFWNQKDNVASARAIGAVIGLNASTYPTRDTSRPGRAPSQSSASDGRRLLDTMHEICRSLDLSDSQKARVRELFDREERRLVSTTVPAETAHPTNLIEVAKALRAILSDRQYIEFADKWSDRSKQNRARPFDDMMRSLSDGLATLDLSERQRLKINLQLARTRMEFQKISDEVASGTSITSEYEAKGRQISAELNGMLKHTLSMEQYKRLESIIGH